MQTLNELTTAKYSKESLNQNSKVSNDKHNTKTLKLPTVYINDDDDDDDDDDYDD